MSYVDDSIEDFRSDLEWTTPVVTHFREITGSLAYSAIYIMCGYLVDSEEIDDKICKSHPDNLEKVIGYTHHCLIPKFDNVGMCELSLIDIYNLLKSILSDLSIVKEWSKIDICGFDIDVLIYQVCFNIRDKRRIMSKYTEKIAEKIKKIINDNKFT